MNEQEFRRLKRRVEYLYILVGLQALTILLISIRT